MCSHPYRRRNKTVGFYLADLTEFSFNSCANNNIASMLTTLKSNYSCIIAETTGSFELILVITVIMSSSLDRAIKVWAVLFEKRVEGERLCVFLDWVYGMTRVVQHANR